jgi:hypothetical protein
MPSFVYAQPGVLQQIFSFRSRIFLGEKKPQEIRAQPANQFRRRLRVRLLVTLQ